MAVVVKSLMAKYKNLKMVAIRELMVVTLLMCKFQVV